MSVELESAKRLTALKNKIDAKTETPSNTLSESIDNVIAGYGQGGGDSEEPKVSDISSLSSFFKSDARIEYFNVVTPSKCTDFYECFMGANQITEITRENFDTSNGTRFRNFASNNTGVIKITCDFSKGTDFAYAFQGCSKLKTLHVDFRSCANNTLLQFVNGCSAMTDLFLYNVKYSITIGSGVSYGHLLTLESLVHTYNELLPVASATLTQGAANNEKIAGLYCRIIDNTNPKLPMELCESTDEGAMEIRDYVSLKGWVIA